MNYNTIHYLMYVQGFVVTRQQLCPLKNEAINAMVWSVFPDNQFVWRVVVLSAHNKRCMFRSRQLELREEAWGGRKKKSSAPFQLQWKSRLWTQHLNSASTHPTERKKSNYSTQATHLSGELICLPPLPPAIHVCLPGPTLSAGACLGHDLAQGWTQMPMMDAQRVDPVTDEPTGKQQEN